ncbi:hypothetical protein PHMEG_00035678 [Phytophthora megakarya]|uniref:RNase H type-1 domain-containing protein n=1 Tax=Phytophthora megakarya TaxID=4795 RepID=A0A225UPR1_9STRA|nr:hypothetical protein PHMEG_00035678 [Phytophthora megakarya]
MSAVPDSFWEIYDKTYRNIPLSDKSEIQHCVHAVAEISWTVGTVITLQAIWARKASYFDNAADSSSDRAIARLHGRLRQAYINTRLIVTANASKGRKEAAKLMCSALLRQHVGVVTVLRLALPNTITILYFDGGSRGNPWSGGAGSLLVTLSPERPTPNVLWMASISLASIRTTNNIAEYRGLHIGLQRAVELRLKGIHIVGDSNIIVAQLRARRPPKAPHLRNLYDQCRGMADRLQVRTWTHHLRAYNRAADKLANVAMDDCVS